MKLFTLEEAKSLLPELKRLWAAIRRHRELLRKFESEAKRASEQSRSGGGIPAGNRYAAALTGIVENLQEIMSLGIEVKDLERGLCDFPSWRDDRVIYLCWQFGEDSIEWWHDTEAGFAGRKPL